MATFGFYHASRPDPASRDCCECGYDLTGNISGRCPECGTPIASL
jgi:hypothetical protein